MNKAMEENKSDKSKSKIIIIIVSIVVVIGCSVAAYFLVPKILGEQAQKSDKKAITSTEDKVKQDTEKPHEEKKENEKKTVKREPSVVVPLKTFIVNVQGGGGRFLKVNIDLDVESKKVSEEIKDKMPQIRDKLITILTEKQANEISNSEGKRKLRYEIIRNINGIIRSGKVMRVYFTEFVMQ